MGMLTEQINELRLMGDGQAAKGEFAVATLLREAADTIERLRKQVAECQIAELKADYDTSRYFELFGTPERAARTLHEMCGGCCGLPERVRGDYDALLEWLRGDA